MLTPSELASLQNLIAEDTKTFDELKISFENVFIKSEHFKVGLTLSFLIKDHQLNLFQEIASFYILFILSSPEKNSRPFNSLVLENLKETKIKIKQKFLIDFLENKITYTNIKIKDFLEITDNLEMITPNIEKYETEYGDSNIFVGGEGAPLGEGGERQILNPLILEKKITDIKLRNKTGINLSQLTPEETSFRYFESNYMTFYPNLLNNSSKLYLNEPCWILPMLNHRYIWENSTYDKISTLLNQILNNIPLSKDESKFIISSIEKNPNLIKNINFTPKQMMQLIEKDEPLSSEILIIILKTSLNE